MLLPAAPQLFRHWQLTIYRNKTAEEDTKQLADKMYDASAKAMESMSDIVWYVNPQNDLLENMLVRMREYALTLLEAKSIQVIFTSAEKVEAVKLTMQQRTLDLISISHPDDREMLEKSAWERLKKF